MPRARKKPTLTVKLSEKSKADLKAHAEAIRAEGEAARARREAVDADRAVKGPARPRGPAAADPVARLRQRIAQGLAKVERLQVQGLYAEMDRTQSTVDALKARLVNAEAAAGRDMDRAARQDRFRMLAERSVILDDWHVAIADRWLAALDKAADGLLQRGARPEAKAGAPDVDEDGLPVVRRDPVTGRRLAPLISGPAMFVSGGTVLDRWGKAVAASEVKLGRRRVPPTFDPKRRNVRGGPAPSSVPATAFEAKGKAHRLTGAFTAALSAAGHPAWCEAVAIRVILSNQTLQGAFVALGVPDNAQKRKQAQTAMAAGLCGVAVALGLNVPG